jgi:hypothetical protein
MNYLKFAKYALTSDEVPREDTSEKCVFEIVTFDCYKKVVTALSKKYISKIKFFCDEGASVRYFFIENIPFLVEDGVLDFKENVILSNIFETHSFKVELSNYEIKNKRIIAHFY